MTEQPRVVIVGGGFGGLSAARVLARAPVQVTLIDRHNYHLFRPMLYQTATGLLSADEIAVPLRVILRRSHNIDAGEHIASRTVLWAAGVHASPAGRWLSAPVDPAGRVIVNRDFSVPEHPDVYVIGDSARVMAPARNLVGRPMRGVALLPGMAQPAIQEGQYVASLIARRARGAPPPKAFWYWDKGNLAIVGRTFAIADLKGIRFSGFLGWVLWIGVHIFYLIGFGNRVGVLARWAGAILLNRRSVRIFPPSGDLEGGKTDAARVLETGIYR